MMVYSHPTDNLAATVVATLSTGTALSAENDVDKLSDGDPSSPFMAVETDVDIDFDFGSPAVLPEFPAIFHHTLDGDVELHAADVDLDTPDETYPFSAVTMIGGRQFTDLWLDLRTGTARQKWRLRITNNTRPVTIGEFWLGSTFRTLGGEQGYLLADAEPAWVGDTVRHRAHGGPVLAYERALGSQVLQGSVIVETQADYDAIREWIALTRFAARPFAMVPRDDPHNDPWFVRFADVTVPRRPFVPNTYDFQIPLPVEQLAYSLPWFDVELE